MVNGATLLIFLFPDIDESFQTSFAHKWGKYTSALITTRLIQKCSTKIPIFAVIVGTT